jgi:putative hydrolase of the HAD superfamily
MTGEKMNKFVFWDFDGTLVTFNSWRPAIIEVLDEHEPGHDKDIEMVRPFLRDGFPWHSPETPHTHLNAPDDWWRAMELLFYQCYRGLGYTEARAAVLAPLVRQYMTKPERFTLYKDALGVLGQLQAGGWRHAIITNHMPELPNIVKALGLSPYIEFCVDSALTGYEKPNPQAFRLALALAGNPEQAWMVGDNMVSDIKGAEAVGIPAILVNVPHVHSNQVADIKDIRYQAADLTGVVKIIEENSR